MDQNTIIQVYKPRPGCVMYLQLPVTASYLVKLQNYQTTNHQVYVIRRLQLHLLLANIFENISHFNSASANNIKVQYV